MLEQRKYVTNYTNVIEFPAHKINNKNNRNGKSVITVLGKRYWMSGEKIRIYKAICITFGVLSIVAEFVLLYMYLWIKSF